MGMLSECSKGCGYSAPSDSHRGARLGSCPECGAPLQAHTAGKARGRYSCPVSGWVYTLGLGGTVQLTEPMRLVFVPGWDLSSTREPDPDRPGWTRAVRRHRDSPTECEQKNLDRAGGRVFGPGCVLGHSYAQPEPGDRSYGKAGTYLVPAPDTDPASWFVNEKLTYRQCAACTKKVPVTSQSVMTEPWTPRRTSYPSGRGYSRRYVDTRPGPHPAGTVTCPDCDPRKADEEPF